MKQIKTIEEMTAGVFDLEVNKALSEGWKLVRRYVNGDYFIAELEQETITEAERSCENCKHFDKRPHERPCCDCEDASKWEEDQVMNEIRPCIVFLPSKPEVVRAIFHQWVTYAYVVGESPLRGGHAAGQVSKTTALVEFEDGTVHEVEPYKVRFFDTENKTHNAWTETAVKALRDWVEKESKKDGKP